MPQDYTLSDAQKVLKTDNKMLQKWIADAVQSGEPMRPHVDPTNHSRKLLTRAQVERLAALHGRTLPPDPPASLSPSVEDRLATLERNQAALLARLATLERRLEEMASQRPVAPQQATSSSADPSLPIQPKIPPESPSSASRGIRPAPKPSTTKHHFTTTWRAQEYLFEHGVPRKDVARLSEVPRESQEAALSYALRLGYTLRPCGRDGCPCQDVIG